MAGKKLNKNTKELLIRALKEKITHKQAELKRLKMKLKDIEKTKCIKK